MDMKFQTEGQKADSRIFKTVSLFLLLPSMAPRMTS